MSTEFDLILPFSPISYNNTETLSEATFAEASEEEESEDPNIDIDYTS